MHSRQRAIEGELRYDPLDQCSIVLCQILPVLSLQNVHPSAFVDMLEDIPMTILLAAIRAGSDGPIRSRIFHHILEQVSHVNDIELLDHDVLENVPRAAIPNDTQRDGTRECHNSIAVDATRPSIFEELFGIASTLVPLTLDFIDEWSDVRTGVDVLNGCSSLKEPSPFNERDKEILEVGLALVNGLGMTEKHQLAVAMPKFLSFDTDSLQVLWRDDFLTQKRHLEVRNEKRYRAAHSYTDPTILKE